jgi:hypothetical protein
MGGHWVREGKPFTLDNTLDALMTADYVVRVLDDGTVSEDTSGVYAPELNVTLDADGQTVDIDAADLIATAKRSGWGIETGWSNQYAYAGPFLHSSEFIGGGLAEHILETPGYWVVVVPSVTSGHCTDGDNLCGDCVREEERGSDDWLILHREA